MNIGEKLIQLRKTKGMSQEDLAQKIGLSRQAISRWENGSALPDANNLLALSEIYGVSTDYLLNDHFESDEDLPKVKENKKILHSNLTLIAIILQASFLNAAFATYTGTGEDQTFMTIFKIVPLLLTSIWMASNHRYELDMVQRVKNTKIELLYCVIQALIAFFGYHFKLGIVTPLLLIAVLMTYIFVVNPKFMNRRFVKSKNPRP
ncbi:helix-turn-helix domain-containing protein [Guggenheimella bovis]